MTVPLAQADARLEPIVLTAVAAGLATAIGVVGLRRLLRVAAVAAVTAAALALPVSSAGAWLEAADAGICLTVAALGVVVVTGWGGQLFLAPLALTGIAASATAWLSTDLGQPLAVGIAGALLLTLSVGLLVGAVCAGRRSQAAVAVLSLGLAAAVDAALVRPHAPSPGTWSLPGALPGAVSLGGRVLDGRTVDHGALLVLLALCLLAVAVLRRSRLRLELQAGRSQRAALARGVDVVTARRAAHGVAALLAGAAGCALAAVPTHVSADVVSPAGSVRLVALVVLLGRARLASAALAGLVCGAVPVIAAHGHPMSAPATWIDLALGTTVLLAVLGQELRRRSHKSLHDLLGCAAAHVARSVTASREGPGRLQTMSGDTE